MGIYTSLLENELNSVQDPNDTGVDLNQVEKDICGPDGIESHSEEIDDANSGIVGEPLEEAYMCLYESEYNYNMLMQAIGLDEMKTMQNGGLKAVNEGERFDKVKETAKNFFDKVKEMLVSAFKKITEAFRAVMTKFMSLVKGDAKFAKQYESRIRDGFTKEWKAKGFTYKNAKGSFLNANLFAQGDNDVAMFNNEVKKGYPEARTLNKAEVILDHTGIRCDDVSELHKKLITDWRGSSEPVDLNGKIKDSEVLEILNSDDVKTVKSHYEGIKKTYKKAIDDITKMQRSITSSGESENVSGQLAVCTYYGNRVRFGQNIENMKYSCALKMARERRSQARRLATMWAGLSDSKQKVVKSTSESGPVSRIANVQII